MTNPTHGARSIAAHAAQPRPAILEIGTAVPPYKLDQRTFGNRLAALFADRPRVARLVQSLHSVSGIETRYSCIPDYLLPAEESCYMPGQTRHRSPSTGERMAIYAREAGPLGAEAAQRSLVNFARRGNLSLAEATERITHLVVITCTGFFAPGLDIALARELGLAPTVQRTLIGFMGCAAMFNGLRVASQAVEADPNAHVLVVSVELCSLHSQPDSRRDMLIAASLFGDGASACIVGLPAPGLGGYFQLDQFLSTVKPNTGGEMVWTIGERGFELHLSPRIPDHLAKAVPHSLDSLFGDERPGFWAIHPGGRAILDRLGEIFALDARHLEPSRAVLRRVGNVSSATLLFVLDEIRNGFDCEGTHLQTHSNGHADPNGHSGPHTPQGVAMAFGPGLVIEMARLSYVAGPVARMEQAGAPHADRVPALPRTLA